MSLFTAANQNWRCWAALPAALYFLTSFLAGTALQAQIVIFDGDRTTFAAKSSADQAQTLASIVSKSRKGAECKRASVSSATAGSGPPDQYLVICDDIHDYLVTLPAIAGKAAIVLPCIVVQATTGQSCYVNLRTYDAADVQRCSSENSATPDPIIRSCTALLQSGKLDGQPRGQAAVYGLRGRAFGNVGQYDLALADLDRAIELNPNSDENLFNRAVTLERKGKFDGALADLERVLKINPKSWLALYERGFIEFRKRDYAKAIVDFDSVLTLNPGFANAIKYKEEAIRARDAAKTPTSVADAASSVPPTYSGKDSSDEEATYCMEASFNYLKRSNALLPRLAEAEQQLQSMLQKPALAPGEREAITARLKSLGATKSATDADKIRWETTLKVYTDFLQRRGRLTGSGIRELAGSSDKAQADAMSIHETYTSCLRECKPADQECRSRCDNKANTSEANARMLRCRTIVGQFK
jgi:tetratricopeptide (TPR) repeat protein